MSLIRVGRCTYTGSKRVDPTYPGYRNIVVLTKSASKYGAIGPYLLRNSAGHIFENVWQFSKVYRTVPKSEQREHRFSSTVVWSHPAETHVRDERLTPEYLAWRHKGFCADYPIRYPVGMRHRSECLYALMSAEGETEPVQPLQPLSYVEARKQIYLTQYMALVREHPLFHELLKMVRHGIPIMMVEVDAPHQESLAYYRETYGVPEDFIQSGSMQATYENLDIMLNDTRHAFGHGYCMAWALLDALGSDRS